MDTYTVGVKYKGNGGPIDNINSLRDYISGPFKDKCGGASVIKSFHGYDAEIDFDEKEQAETFLRLYPVDLEYLVSEATIISSPVRYDSADLKKWNTPAWQSVKKAAKQYQNKVKEQQGSLSLADSGNLSISEENNEDYTNLELDAIAVACAEKRR